MCAKVFELVPVTGRAANNYSGRTINCADQAQKYCARRMQPEMRIGIGKINPLRRRLRGA